MTEKTQIRIGTSAFTAAGWEGSFYPAGMPAAEYLSYYASKFDTVELDSTFYGTPALSTVQGWYAKTPPEFVFAAKVPQLCGDENYVATRLERLRFRTVFDFVGHII
jgi:uncharacterized protein YecE (DUF72 family)